MDDNVSNGDWRHLLEYGDDGRSIVGDLEWRWCPGRTIEMHIDVADGCQRKGVGSLLLSRLEFHAKKHEAMSIYSFCAGDNQKARGFFTKNGFTLYEVPGLYGEGRSGCFLVKTIGAPK